jgi:mono/diheme cytochrome c family protein
MRSGGNITAGLPDHRWPNSHGQRRITMPTAVKVMIMARYVLLVGLAVLFLGTLGLAQDRSTLIEQGKQLFLKQGCYGCHRVGKVGTPLGPDLSHVGSEYSLPYLTGWLRDPASQKPTAHMPKIELTEEEIQSLVAYLSSLR